LFDCTKQTLAHIRFDRLCHTLGFGSDAALDISFLSLDVHHRRMALL
jgi:hypothetical protein